MQSGSGGALSLTTDGVKASLSCRRCVFKDNRADYGAVVDSWPGGDVVRTTVDLSGGAFEGACAGAPAALKARGIGQVLAPALRERVTPLHAPPGSCPHACAFEPHPSARPIRPPPGNQDFHEANDWPEEAVCFGRGVVLQDPAAGLGLAPCPESNCVLCRDQAGRNATAAAAQGAAAVAASAMASAKGPRPAAAVVAAAAAADAKPAAPAAADDGERGWGPVGASSVGL